MTTLKYDSRNRLVEAGGTTYTYDACNNRIGSTTAITSEQGVIVVSYSYGPYGELLTDSEGEDFLYNGAYGVATDDNGLY